MDITVRICHLEDLFSIVDLCKIWADERLMRNYHADTAEELKPRMSDYFIVAEVDHRILGFVIGEMRPCANNDAVDGAFNGQPEHYLEIQDLYVHPSHRGHGIGTRLMGAIVGAAEAKDLRCSLVYSANTDYVRTAKFYERCSFQIWHIYMTRQA